MIKGLESGWTVVSGACGLIGKAVVKKILENDGRVLACDINKVGLDMMISDFDSHLLHTLAVDITEENGLELLAEKINSLGALTGAVHAAYPRSKGWGARLEGLRRDDLDMNLSLQLGSAIMFSKYITGHFAQNGGGSLVHVSSIQGISAPKFEHYKGTNMHSPIEYSAIKAGVIAITKWLAKYYSGNNIRVNSISPGGVLDNQEESFVRRYRASCTNIGMLNANDVAEGVYFLLSEKSAGLNGYNMVMDDGWSL
jgi:NAD(P)-dependent dehydrogenase (short-subunit alcohol dehydrogenase family)